MTRTFTYTFTTYKREGNTLVLNDHTMRLSVTDRMEERDAHKAGYASRRFNETLREQYGYKRDVVKAWMLKEER